MYMLNKITQEEFETEAFYCKCGNTAYGSGFFPCDAQGKEIEPTEEDGWNGLYVCADCGVIYSVE